MYGRVPSHEGPQPAHGCHGVFAETEEVSHDTFIHLNSHRINSTLMENWNVRFLKSHSMPRLS